MNQILHYNEWRWYQGCTFVHPSLFALSINGFLSYHIVHLGLLERESNYMAHCNYILMELVHHYMYYWCQGCIMIHPPLLFILLHSAVTYYIIFICILGSQRNIRDYYCIVIVMWGYLYVLPARYWRS